MKQPHIQFYTGDWLKDPKLSMCSPTTRGIWIDLICAMHELDRCGELRLTTFQLSRLARCSEAEAKQSLSELQATDAANVEQNGEVWIVTNRRMKKSYEISQKRAESGSKGGSKTSSLSCVRACADIDNDNGLERVREFARGEGISDSDAQWFFWKGKGNGWMNGGKPILDWQATLRSWKRAGYLPSQKQQSRNGPATYQKPKEIAPSYPSMSPSREPTDEEVAKAKEIAQREVAKLREQFRMP